MENEKHKLTYGVIGFILGLIITSFASPFISPYALKFYNFVSPSKTQAIFLVLNQTTVDGAIMNGSLVLMSGRLDLLYINNTGNVSIKNVTIQVTSPNYPITSPPEEQDNWSVILESNYTGTGSYGFYLFNSNLNPHQRDRFDFIVGGSEKYTPNKSQKVHVSVSPQVNCKIISYYTYSENLIPGNNIWGHYNINIYLPFNINITGPINCSLFTS
jgi:hypothetical protein